MPNAIITENQNTGSTGWIITNTTWAELSIAGYLSATSVDPGGSLTVYVSTQTAGTTYSISVYRLGWYGGMGGRLMTTITGLVGQAQGYWDYNALVLHNCPTAYSDPTTGLFEARFASSYTFTIPSDWVTGCYVAILTDQSGLQAYMHFVVRCAVNATHDYVFVKSDMTDQAYNNWGGKSLYTDNSTGGVAAVKVSFDRPSTNSHGGDQHIMIDVQFIKWAERQGYDIGYLSDVDVHVNGLSCLAGHKVAIALGHAEYWTYEQRGAFENALTSGVSLAFMGGNSLYWQVRMESGGQNGTNRTMTCYKVLTNASGGIGSNDAAPATDPYYGVTNAKVTTQWRDPILNRPECTLMGIMYSALTNGALIGWTVDASANSPYLAGTGLVDGSTYGTDIVGQEWDKVQSASPANIQIIGTTATIKQGGGSDTSHTTTYRAPSGALVFASGSYCWPWALDDYRYSPYPYPGSPGLHVPQMQTLMANIMGALKGPVFSMMSI